MVKMIVNKTPINTKKYICDKCNFACSKQCDYNRHIMTLKHKRNVNGIELAINGNGNFYCECGKVYKYSPGLYRHKRTCLYEEDNIISIEEENVPISSNKLEKRDDLIEKLLSELQEERAENTEMKSMFMLMMEQYQEMQVKNQEQYQETVKGNQELVNKVINVLPNIGNTTNNNTTNNNNNNTLNFYLTNTCKDAESIHDFTDRYVKQCTDFFKENYRHIANNEMCLATNVYNIMFKCLKENPQYLNFIQTTDVKNGVHYVKEKKKDENRKLHGEAEFIKYVDGFEKAGASIGHAINKSFLPLQTEFVSQLEKEIGNPPYEDDFDDESKYEDALYNYKIRKRESSSSVKTNVCNTISLFDNNTRKMDILKKTKRVRDDEIMIK